MRRVGDALVVCTNRHGGVSAPPFESLNLGRLTDDDPAAVRTNWVRVVDVLCGLGVEPRGGVDGIAWLHQVHGTAVHVVGRRDLPGPDAAGDALITTDVGLPLSVGVADCAPVALVAPAAVAAVHVGWRGLAAGVVGATVARLREVSAQGAGGEIRAVLGPCIHPESYEFDPVDLADLIGALGPDVAGTTCDGAPALDLPAAVRSELAGAGVTDLDDVDVCTAASPDHFSHRRDAPTGRQALLVTRLR